MNDRRHRPYRGWDDDMMAVVVQCASGQHRKDWTWPCPAGRYVVLTTEEQKLADWWAGINAAALR